jgi:hypothetical protein
MPAPIRKALHTTRYALGPLREGEGMERRLGDASCNLGATRTAEKARKHSSMPGPVWHDLRVPAVV